MKLLGGVIKPKTNNMDTFKERLIDEQNQLEDKIQKLDSFISSPKFKEIEPIQKSLLDVQFFAMQTYSSILSERISHLEKLS